jgi:hypothetical protein
MPRQLTWEPSDADITAYLLDDLGGARAEYVAAHLAQCPACRERLRRLKQTLARLEAMPQPGDDRAQSQHALTARIQIEVTGMTQPPKVWWQRAQMGLAAVALLTLVIVLGPVLASAGSAGIREIIGIDAELGFSSRHSESGATANPRPTIAPSDLPYGPVAPNSLPGSNQLLDTVAWADGTFRARYRGADGLWLDLRQEVAATDAVRLGPDAKHEEIRIGDVTAIITVDKQLNNVDQVFWVRGGILFTLRAIHSGQDDFPMSEAFKIVERLMELQDHPEVIQQHASPYLAKGIST